MTKLQLINLVLSWQFFGFFSAYIAKKGGRNPFLWFSLAPIVGPLGFALLFLLPKPVRKKQQASSVQHVKVLPPASFHEAWTKFWYYLDKTNSQKGPIEFPDLAKNLEKKEINEQSFVWGEGMKEWKRLNELPDILKEMEKNRMKTPANTEKK